MLIRDRIVLQVEVDRPSEHVVPAELVREALLRHAELLQSHIANRDGPASYGVQEIPGVGRVRWQHLGSEDVGDGAAAAG